MKGGYVMKKSLKVDLILAVIKEYGKPIKISEIAKKLQIQGYSITQDQVVNYFYSKNYRLIDMMEKIPPYYYKLKVVES